MLNTVSKDIKNNGENIKYLFNDYNNDINNKKNNVNINKNINLIKNIKSKKSNNIYMKILILEKKEN